MENVFESLIAFSNDHKSTADNESGVELNELFRCHDNHD